MPITDLFVRRPVLSLVVSALILVIGLRAMFSLPILQYPQMQNGVVTITTTYAGADSDIIAGFITSPLENVIAQANGIDTMTSSSQTGVSAITVHLRLNYDSGNALTEISTKVSSVLNQLPAGTQQPILALKMGATIDAMYIAFSSTVLAENEVTDYVARVVQPKLQAVAGVQVAEILGGKNFALRAWLDPDKMASLGLTATDVASALKTNDYISGVGTTKGRLVQVKLSAATNMQSVQAFRDLIIKTVGGAVIRLKDVANVSLGSDDYDSRTSFNGKSAVYIGIQVAPSANLLDVIQGVRQTLPGILSDLPSGLSGTVLYDATQFVNTSIREVVISLFEAALIVTLVVFAFLGSWRSVFIPIVAIPLSLIGSFALMLVLGFSINLLTLLALVLAIGLVVDDAIIVVEGVNRHMELGLKPIDAAITAARELSGPIIAMTAVLIAVYVPVGFQGGLTGSLFTEFAFTLVAAVLVSAVVALTLSPMSCAHLLAPHDPSARTLEARMVRGIDGAMRSVTGAYRTALTASLRLLPLTILFGAVVLTSVTWLYSHSTSQLAPPEDQGVILTMMSAAPNATLEQRETYVQQIYGILDKRPETDLVFQIDMPGQVIGGWVLKPWDQRSQSALALAPLIQQEFNKIAGVRVAAFQLPPLPGSSGLPIQFVLKSNDSYARLYQASENFLSEAMKSGKFIFLDGDMKIDQPHASIHFDRDKVASLGLTMTDVGAAMSTMLGGSYANYFDLGGRSYKVIPQVMQQHRLNTDQLLNYYIRAADGTSVPLSTIARIEMKTVPQSLNHFQQLNASTISGIAMPGVSDGDALAELRAVAARALPSGYSYDYAGSSRQLENESNGFVTTFALALLIIFLVLAALFNSFRDPLVILVSVPMSLAGALFFIWLGVGGASINIYTQVGLVTLMGLVSKHGILMVEVANTLREEGRSKHDAIIEAATIRLRAILMTTAAMVLGVTPLIVATGAGANSRFNMGLVIATGLAIGTLFTLFVVPAFYLLLSHRDQPEPAPAVASA
ncbi:multidrug efflux pump [Rhodopseudomonas rhenobacensis]|uniref:Multidrug efflux pump n=1 Tax=Rhodopseudomonas rhenobacensis TaxID=87461 RepID=A0A7W7Z196_9BRAD|nr:efflux RND transporter permease subunit [Rhodopseudomonas rhenobacensis]MBB5046066.1 multidrug efflux pump [Rhodopseudomonas rhenobacensis]